MFPVASAVAVVVPNANLSSLSSQMIIALSPVLPLSMIIPESLELDEAPEFNSSRLSSIRVLVTLRVVVVPLTVKLPPTVRSDCVVIVLSPFILIASAAAVEVAVLKTKSVVLTVEECVASASAIIEASRRLASPPALCNGAWNSIPPTVLPSTRSASLVESVSMPGCPTGPLMSKTAADVVDA